MGIDLDPHLRPGLVSRVLRVVGEFAAKSGTGAVVAVVVVASVLALAATGFPPRWSTAFGTIVAALTFIMVFVIQHTQSREQLTTQLKLDELIRSSPHADDLMVHLEAADDEEVRAEEERQRAHHAALRAE